MVKIKVLILITLILLCILSFSLRVGNVDSLVNIATGEPVLGPDLDPYLFLRHAEEIVEGSLENPDTMRAYPRGTVNYAYTNLEAWKIAGLYYLVGYFNPSFTVMKAAIYSPVVWFTLSIIPFFFLIYFLLLFAFSRSNSCFGAGLSTILYSVLTILIPRTVAGIPESEPHAFVWLWLGLLFFILAWKSQDKKTIAIYSILAGLATAVMAWTWGGYAFILLTVSVASFLILITGKDLTKNLTILSIFTIFSIPLIAVKLLFRGHDIWSVLTAIDIFILIITLILIINWSILKYVGVEIVWWKVLIFVGVLGAVIIISTPELLQPFGNTRTGLTVSENRIPSLDIILGNLGYMFWLLVGGLMLVSSMFWNDLKNSKYRFEIIFLLALSFVAIAAMITAIRFIMIAYMFIIPISIYLIIKLFTFVNLVSDKVIRICLIICSLAVFGLFIGNIYMNAKGSQELVEQMVPTPYHHQWYFAMQWVEENTPTNSVFVHWWDYGYWIQTLGKRTTLSDGGYNGGWITHVIARYLLTTPYPETAMSLMKSFDVDYLLIDSTDLGKYFAYSSIGSDITGEDRKTHIPLFLLENSKMENDTAELLYRGGFKFDEDIYLANTNFRKDRAGVAGFEIKYDGKYNFKQPKGIIINNNQRYDIPIRYLYYNGNFIDFGNGLNATVMIIPSLIPSSNGSVKVEHLGAAIYLTSKTQNSLFTQLYLFNNVNNHYPTLTLERAEDDYIIKILKNDGLDIGSFIYYRGFRGPIKIWKVEYCDTVLTNEEFVYPKTVKSVDDLWGKLDNEVFVK